MRAFRVFGSSFCTCPQNLLSVNSSRRSQHAFRQMQMQRDYSEEELKSYYPIAAQGTRCKACLDLRLCCRVSSYSQVIMFVLHRSLIHITSAHCPSIFGQEKEISQTNKGTLHLCTGVNWLEWHGTLQLCDRDFVTVVSGSCHYRQAYDRFRSFNSCSSKRFSGNLCGRMNTQNNTALKRTEEEHYYVNAWYQHCYQPPHAYL